MSSIAKLVEIVTQLRAPDGCPWDREQTHQSIRNLLLEECYEVIEAIDEDNDTMLREELGDVLLHIVFHAQLASERGAFSLDDVTTAICDKLIRRHPHVFGDEKCSDSSEVLQQWEELKKQEKADRKSRLDGIPPILPALMEAREMQKKAAKAGFDWDDPTGVLHKTCEELCELETALESGDPTHIKEEIGDLLFSLVNLARHLKVDAEEACRLTNRKFSRRFRHIETALEKDGKTMEETPIDELESYWQNAKSAT